ncbi:uncharacterized protein BDZ99DRAFT_520238 [Mytilinidion resinicola]|uniref:Uncharacterized protein n=1 Tax=Mytilinidion resinicola TaxID=574789 RepID=A0A6A6YNN8_9PEZI|nr:uncharacterized protein BDZ99DRAFT_520238 [Mytilinidion resinicola]KAF2810148.1 hypothetical protein BDZ99DRAFT_520238 [Mytilinidion resinicola]
MVNLSFVTLLVRADKNFSSPLPEGFNVAAGIQVVVSWTTDWGSVPISLAVYQADGSGWKSPVLLDYQDDPGSYVWTAQTIEDLPTTEGFHFCVWLGDVSESSHLTDSNSFNSDAVFIVDDATTPSTAVLSSTSIASSSSSSPPSTSSKTSPSTFESTTSTIGPTTSANDIRGPASAKPYAIFQSVRHLGSRYQQRFSRKRGKYRDHRRLCPWRGPRLAHAAFRLAWLSEEQEGEKSGAYKDEKSSPELESSNGS